MDDTILKVVLLEQVIDMELEIKSGKNKENIIEQILSRLKKSLNIAKYHYICT